MRLFLAALLTAATFAGCGGGNPGTPASQTVLLASVATSDVRVFAGLRANYTIAPNADGSFTVTDLVGGAAPVVVPANARLRFADTSLALDIDGNAGQAYRLYKAAFNRTPDAAGLGFWIEALGHGATLQDVANGFVQSAEYKSVYGSAPTSQQIVERYYQNILGRAGEQAGIDFWKGALDTAAATPAAVLAGFSESAENQAGVIASIQTGVPFLESGVAYQPVADAGITHTADVGKLATLDGSRSTVAAGKSITYAWTLTAKPAGSVAALVQASTAHPSFIPDLPGTYEVSLKVSDGTNTSVASTSDVIALWRPADSAVPATGNFVYLEGQAGDYIVGNASLLYTPADTVFTVNSSGPSLSVSLKGDTWWTGNFVGMNNLTKLQRGYYGDLSRYPFNNPVKGGLDWSGSGRGCNTLTGWFMVDSVTYDGTRLTAIDLRFEQHCEGNAAALHGRIRWDASDTTSAPGPVTPVPAGLWQPAPGATPASGNYVYLSSMAGDFIGGGSTYVFTDTNAQMKVSASGAHASLNITGDQWWSGDFVGMNFLSQLQPGYYGNLERYPFNNPLKGGLNWSGQGRGCNTLTGWFVVDSVTYAQGSLTALDLRFEQHCEGGQPALHGKVHWSAANTASPPGPI